MPQDAVPRAGRPDPQPEHPQKVALCLMVGITVAIVVLAFLTASGSQ